MTPDEARAAGVLAGSALSGAGAVTASASQAVARRLQRVGPVSGMVALGAVGTQATARLVAALAPAVSAAAAETVAALRPSGAPTLRDGRGAALVAAVAGHHPAVRDGALDVAMAVRDEARDVPLVPGALAAAFPGAGPVVAVWLPGLGETEDCWARGDTAFPTLPDRLAADLGATSVLVRYSTGRSLAENGEAFAALLAGLVTAWPVPVRHLILVGHSMGGLVARTAATSGVAHGHAWPALVRLVVTLGSPHDGAPLARVADPVARSLDRLPETAAIAALVRARSHGIRDLAHGVTDDHLPGVRYVFVAGTLAGRAGGIVDRTVGDLLVPVPSAHERAAPTGEPIRVTLPRTHHQGLLDDADGYAHLLGQARSSLA